jgi:hypothetical protein
MGGAVEPPFVGRDVGKVTDPDFVRSESLELLRQEILRHGESMRRTSRCLELLDLRAPDAAPLPDTSDAMDTRGDAVSGEVFLEPFRAAGFAGPFVGGLYLDFEPPLLLRPF